MYEVEFTQMDDKHGWNGWKGGNTDKHRWSINMGGIGGRVGILPNL